jgi:hypothetical protein
MDNAALNPPSKARFKLDLLAARGCVLSCSPRGIALSGWERKQVMEAIREMQNRLAVIAAEVYGSVPSEPDQCKA